jgi:exopolysaccharide biosynthesis polyprenyl glycosylphosphotransferase
LHARKTTALRNLHLVLDAATIVASMLIAAGVHPTLQRWLPFVREMPPFGVHATLVYLTLPLWLALVVSLRLHHSFEQVWSPGELLLKLVKLHFAGLLGLAVIQFLTQSIINRSLVVLFLSCTFVTMLVERLMLSAWVRFQYRRGQIQQRILLVGQLSKRMGDFIRDAQRQPLTPHLLGYLRAPLPGGALSVPPPGIGEIACLGTLDELGRVLHEQAVDQVMFFPPSNRPEELPEALSLCETLGITASFSVSLTQVARAAPRITSTYEHPFVSFEVAPKRPEWISLKYGLDPLLAAVLLLLLSPLLLLVSLAILIFMGRPVLFSQPRAGLHGRAFRMLKFRSMIAGAEAQRDELRDANEMSGPVFKIKEDPRITPLGRVLRKTSLDELPQLLNVLTGSMTLVGPRPLPLVEQQQIRGWQRRRLSMKPGVTGLWQVSGRNELDFEEWMLLDLKYIDEWSPLFDLTILLRTIPVVLLGRGAR